MSQLLLIRHGQAAAYTQNPDSLTELGKRQAQKIGAYLVAQGVRIDEVHTGTLSRQIDTERIAGEAFRTAGLPWPEARRHAGWNEYDASAIMSGLSPELLERDPSYRKLMDDFEAHSGSRDRNRYFQRMFEALMEHWVSGTLTADGVEAFELFHARVLAAREQILAGPESRTVAVFTSGGPIGACVQLALQAPKAMAVHLNWRVKNGSITEFVFSKSRLSLDAFNAVAHLDTKDLISYR